ncbi:rod shape-determining protein RodA [Candidatus Uhrbacteria bacterium]|nr:rod shape-determining protein RodA [Candidatus Uhrbacteria bacterium]
MLHRLKQLDIPLLIVVIFFATISLSSLYSIGAGRGGDAMKYFERQSIYFVVSMVAALTVSFIRHTFFRSVSALIYLASTASLIAVLFIGTTVRGTKGWIALGELTLQPVEFAKIGVILALAGYFSIFTRQVHHLRHIIVSGLIAAVPAGFVLLQPDIGSAAIILFIWFTMILVSGISKKYLLYIGTLASVCIFASWMFLLHDYQKDRILAFIHPTAETQSRGYNVRQAMIAIGSGQLFGKGLGRGSQTQLRFLPEAQTDFIFSVIAEELGLFGILLLLIAWGVFFQRLFALMAKINDDFSLYLLFGVAALFFIHLIINIGGNLGLLPLTGIVLPFLSYGGSAMLLAFLSLGIVQSIAIHSPTGAQKS